MNINTNKVAEANTKNPIIIYKLINKMRYITSKIELASKAAPIVF
jgi:hypothetical protein